MPLYTRALHRLDVAGRSRLGLALSDGFATLDTGVWTPGDAGQVTATGGQLVCTQNVDYTGKIVSAARFGLVGGSATVEVPQIAGGGAVAVETYAEVGDSASGGYRLAVDREGAAPALYCWRMPGAEAFTLINSATAYNAVTHRWWRLRETAGSVFYETSPDGRTWTTLASAAVVTPLTSLRVTLATGYYAASPGTGAAIFDNVSVIGRVA